MVGINLKGIATKDMTTKDMATMNDPKKPQPEVEDGEEKQEGLPWDHPDQDPDAKPDLDDLKKSAE